VAQREGLQRVLRIPVRGATEVVEAHVNLRWLQLQVGGYIEAIDVTRVLTDSGMRSAPCTVWGNDDAKNIGLPINPRATDLCAVAIGGWSRDVVCGDVVVAGPPDREGAGTPVPDAVVAIVREWGWFDRPQGEQASCAACGAVDHGTDAVCACGAVLAEGSARAEGGGAAPLGE
jgi:hypothetical protein